MNIQALFSRRNRGQKDKLIKNVSPSFYRLPGILGPALIALGLFLSLSCGETQKKKEDVDYSLDRNPPKPAAGQAYLYKHTGPRPWSDGYQDATGGRFVVIPEDKIPNKSLWNVEEHFERSDGAQTMQIDDKYRMHFVAIKSGETEIVIQYAPALPLRFLDLKKDKTETYKSRFTFINPQTKEPLQGGGEYTCEVERKYDVRIVSPAGAYLCRQFVIHSTIETTVQDSKTTFKAAINSFWCDDIGWFVKEEYTFEPLLANGQVVNPAYTAESILTQYKPMNPSSLQRLDEELEK